jgi:hypothetical protein
MFLIFGGLILTSVVGYYNRNYIFSFVFKITLFSVLNCIKLYSFIYRNNGNKINKIKYQKIRDLYIEEYEIYLNGKKHDTVLIANSSIILTENFNELMPNISNKLQNKNKIVYCNIINENGDVVIELTNIFRKFFYYFDKTDFKLKMFFDYIQDYCDEKYDIYNGINIYEYDFVVYLNDDSFTELGYKIKYIKEKSINDILIKNDL